MRLVHRRHDHREREVGARNGADPPELLARRFKHAPSHAREVVKVVERLSRFVFTAMVLRLGAGARAVVRCIQRAGTAL
jgi:hypothetical protein